MKIICCSSSIMLQKHTNTSLCEYCYSSNVRMESSFSTLNTFCSNPKKISHKIWKMLRNLRLNLIFYVWLCAFRFVCACTGHTLTLKLWHEMMGRTINGKLYGNKSCWEVNCLLLYCLTFKKNTLIQKKHTSKIPVACLTWLGTLFIDIFSPLFNELDVSPFVLWSFQANLEIILLCSGVGSVYHSENVATTMPLGQTLFTCIQMHR